MIVTSKEIVTEIRHEELGGKGDMKLSAMIPGALPAHCAGYYQIELEPGCSCGYHVHEGETEIFTILEGVADAMDGDMSVKLYPGDSLVTTSGGGHAMANNSDAKLRFSAVIITEA